MADYNLGYLISKFVNYGSLNANRVNSSATQTSSSQSFSASKSMPSTQSSASSLANPQMGSMEGIDRSLYVKDMMNLPKNINELVYIIQKNISLAQFQQQFGQSVLQRNALSQTQAQILAQLQGLSVSEAQNILMTGSKAMLSQLQATIRNLPISANGLINLTDISALIQANGKDAVTKLIAAMANAAKSGITDLSQLKDTARIINASIAAASQNDSAQTMKMLLLLYLPWLPLQEGVGFDLDIETGEDESSSSILVITITTINFGNVVVTLILESPNSIHINIVCSEEFPKEELNLRINGDEKHYSMQSNISFETKEIKKTEQEKPHAKVNMSNTNEINPFMLLMAHTIIRHTIEIDKNASMGAVSHIDTV